MTKKRSGSKPVDDIRHRAEKSIPESTDSIREMSVLEIQKLIHDLRVHQIELEMQNEALLQAQMATAESQRKYTDLYDFAPVGYFTFDSKGHIIETNVTGASLFGFEKRSLINQPFHRFIIPEHISYFQYHLQKAMEDRSKQTCKLKLIREDESPINAVIETVAVIDDDGAFDHYRSSVTDITEIAMAEQQMARLGAFPALSPFPFIEVDLAGVIHFINPAAERLFPDLCCRGSEHPWLEDWEALTCPFREGGLKENAREVYVGGNWYQQLMYFVEQTGCIHIYGRDITDNKQAERAIKERTAQLETANKELESFGYAISHELYAPLRAIDGYARMILKKHGDKFDEDITRKFNDIRSNTRMMGQLIDDLLAYSHLGRKDMVISKLDMGDIIRDIWKDLNIINQDRNINLLVNEMPPGRGDRTLIKQVYFNLLSNAVKFTKCRDTAHIEAGGYDSKNEHVYHIMDNGVGFDMAYHDKLFGMFQRLQNSSDSDGTGAGLATVQLIVHRHGGRVWAEGKPDKGACFYFTLRKE